MPKLIGTGQLTLTDLNDVIVSATKPSNPTEGQLWWNTTEAQLYVYQNGDWQKSANVIVGGRNLLRNSGLFRDTNGWTVNNGGTNLTVVDKDGFPCLSATGSVKGTVSVPVNNGKEYIYSTEIMFDTDMPLTSSTPLHEWVAVSGLTGQTGIDGFITVDGGQRTLVANKWHKIILRFKVKNDGNAYLFTPFIYKNPMPEKWWMKNIQLTEGNIPTDWSPAPEDTHEIITDITETLGNMANDGILDYNERQVIKDKLTEITGSIVPDAQALLPAFGSLDSGAKGTFYTVRKQAQQIGISTAHAKYKAVETKYTDLKNYLDAMTPVKPWDVSTANQSKVITVVKDTFRDKWLQFYLAVDDLATYTIQVAKENVDNVEMGGTNYASNGSFEIPLTEGLWASSYAGDLREIVDISTEEPPFKFAYHVKATVNKNSGIFVPALWTGKACEALVNREVTIQYWLKYQNIAQGAQTYLLGRFGELVIEGEDAGGVKKYRYPRIHSDSSVTETLYVSGTNMTWKKYTATIKLSLPTGATKLTKVSFKHGLEGCTGEFWTTGIKVELGNKATDWSQSPFDLEQRIYKTEFAVKPDQITSTVTSHQTFTTALNNKVDGAVGAIQVGNGNMIDNSAFNVLDGWRNWGGNGTRTLVNGVTLNGSSAPTTGAKFVASASGEFGYAKDNVPVVKGEPYVLSAWFYLETAGGIYKVQEGDTTMKWTSTNGTTVNGWVRVVHRFIAKGNTTSIYVGQDSTSPASTMTVTAVQLERGNVPSEWGLSMNDIQWGGGRNLLRNSNFARNKVNDSMQWDKNLNGNIVPDGYWSNGYNAGVKPFPTQGYHAHLNVDKFGYPVLEMIDKNSNLVDTSVTPNITGLHRWMGMSNTMLTSDPFCQSLVVGKTYTISMDVMADTVGMRVNVGFHHFETGNATQGFFGFQWNLEDCKTANVWERKYKTFTINDKWDLTKGLALYIYGYFSSVEGSMWVRNVKIEEGTKYTDWSQTPEDVDAFMYGIEDRVTKAEEKITDSAIINTVTQSTSYKNDLGTKANADDLKNYATTGQLDQAQKDANKYADDKIKGIDFTPYVVKSEMQQQIDNVTVKFEAGGGVNLLRNSIGFADFSFWTQTGDANYMKTVSNNALEALGFGKGFYFLPSAYNTRITQDVYVTAGQPYTLSWYINKTNASPSANDDGALWIEFLEGGTTTAVKSTKYKSEVTTKGFEKLSHTYTPVSNIITVRISVNKLADATITGLMMNIGDTPLQWSMATGEIYNTNIRMDMNGIRVAQIVDGKDRGYTQITPDEFAGYYDTNGTGTYEKVFYLKEDETVSKKFRAKDEFTMGGIKIIKIESTSSKGWAFVQSLD
ncbi:receptor-binding protein [Bacillus phage Kirov]|uniref:Receptor-binding protein n=1 Tax=Bacillus phage Kirov TaxID=2783539 RepID=A0A7S6U4Z1_9CAUD|nr:minor head protein [Bacillus phage Kirov]QOV08251.1 receptor-binding protein [Bacillus phage Kirov]